MRRKNVGGKIFLVLVRNTPTSVGKTYRMRGRRGWRRKHPHERGEDKATKSPLAQQWGTPPRAWGRPVLRELFLVLIGNTPTSVGKTQRSWAMRTRPWKHPHGRGEDDAFNFVNVRRMETPPRAWGRRVLQILIPVPLRNTPTGVGKDLCQRYRVTCRSR